jgi:membrane protease YdiL (CAAX protease family)
MSDSAPNMLATPGAPVVLDIRARLIAILEIVLCSSVPTQLAIGAALRAAGVQAADASGRLLLPFVLAQLVADTIVVIVLMVVFMRNHGESASRLWLGSRPVGREVIIGLVTIPLLLIGINILLNTIRLFAPGLHNVKTNPLEQLATTPGEASAFAFAAIVAGGVKEELQRAFMLHRFEQYLGGATVGLVVTSIAFGLLHWIQGWDAAIATGALGACWAWMFLRRRSSVAPVVGHAGFNSLEILRVALVGR